MFQPCSLKTFGTGLRQIWQKVQIFVKFGGLYPQNGARYRKFTNSISRHLCPLPKAIASIFTTCHVLKITSLACRTVTVFLPCIPPFYQTFSGTTATYWARLLYIVLYIYPSTFEWRATTPLLLKHFRENRDYTPYGQKKFTPKFFGPQRSSDSQIVHTPRGTLDGSHYEV